MYKDKFVLSVLHDGYPVKETGNRGFKEVALPFNSEYKIRLKNKNTRSCAARVFIDGKKVSQLGDIIISGGGTVDLERYIDLSLNNGKRFKFVPLYNKDVDDPTSSDNGIIKVEFRKAKQNSINIKPDVYIYDKPFDELPIYKEDNYGPRWASSWEVNNSSGDTTYGTSKSSCDAISMHNVSWCSNKQDCFNGATVEGSKSQQQFTYAELEVENNAVIISLKIVGLGNIRKIDSALYKYCTNCGQKLRRKDRYCSECGRRS